MAIEMINVGFGNVVAVARVVAVTRAGSSPARRLIEGAERQHRLVDATSGRRTRSVIVLDSNHVVLSHMQPRTLAGKLRGLETEDADADSASDASRDRDFA